MNVFRPLAGAAIAGALLLLGGCSSATVAPATAGSSAESAAPTAGGSGAQAKAGSTVETSVLIKKITVGSATVKTFKSTMEATMTVGGQDQTAQVAAVVDQTDPDHVRASVSTSTMGITVQSILDGDSYFLKMDSVWYTATKAQLEARGTALTNTTDQATQLAKLEPYIEKVVFVGSETIDGVSVDHYQLTLPPEALMTVASGKEPTISPEEKSTIETSPYDLWLDENGVTRKFALSVNDSSNTIGITGTMSNINEPVTIEIPTDAQPLPV